MKSQLNIPYGRSKYNMINTVALSKKGNTLPIGFGGVISQSLKNRLIHAYDFIVIETQVEATQSGQIHLFLFWLYDMF